MEQINITREEKFGTLHSILIKKLDLIADYIKKGMNDYAMIEIWSVQECLQTQLSDIKNLIPARTI